MLFISHNLGLILETCDRITVMYSGEAVEVGQVDDVFDRMRHPYTRGLFNSIALPGTDKNARPLLSIPGQFPLAASASAGLLLRPTLRVFVGGVCDARDIPMQPAGIGDGHLSRCERINEIDWNAEPERNKVEEAVEPGEVVLSIKDLKKYYSVSANSMFGGGDARTVKANESDQLRGPCRGNGGYRGRVRMR